MMCLHGDGVGVSTFQMEGSTLQKEMILFLDKYLSGYLVLRISCISDLRDFFSTRCRLGVDFFAAVFLIKLNMSGNFF